MVGHGHVTATTPAPANEHVRCSGRYPSLPSAVTMCRMSIPFYTEAVDSAPVASATVMVVRDGVSGLEVLMVRRHGDAGVLGGAHVFPGGKIDEADAQVLPDWLDADPVQCAQRLGEPELDHAAAVALHVAALRETWEEVGLVLGHGPLAEAHTRALQNKLSHGLPWSEAMGTAGLVLPVSALLPWSRWITPRLPSVTRKRFDTRFFLAVAPAGQEASHDGHEATEAVWLSPQDALQRFWSDQIELAPPQIMSLSELARHRSVRSAWQHASGRRPPLIEPHPFDREGCRVICYPGDPEHPVREAAWPGPTRLSYRNRRFEPDGGLAALLA